MPVAAGLAALLLLLAAAPAGAITGIEQDEDVADLLVTRPTEYGEEETEGRRWAILPQVGYGPDTGPLGGLKYTHRSLFGTGVFFDVDGTTPSTSSSPSGSPSAHRTSR